MKRRISRFLGLFILSLLFFQFYGFAQENTPWPFSVQKNNRFLLDKNGHPYWLNGDAAWSLLVQPAMQEAERFIQYRSKQGFNALLVNVIERRYSDDPPRTTEGGIEPFLVPEDMRTPNDAYFKRLDHLLDVAESNGMTILLFPIYLGYLNEGEGWYDVLLKNGVDAVREYGRFIARRYAHRPNIIWMMAGDHNPDVALPHITAVAESILEVNPHAVISAHCHPNVSVRPAYNDASWLNLSNVYSYGFVHDAIRSEYDKNPVKPFFLLEATYENERGASSQQIRRQQWWAVCGGATGGFMGNNPIWKMGKGWMEHWDSPGARAMEIVKRIMDTIPWYTYVPDHHKEVLLSGWGEQHGTNYAGFTVGSSGALGYFPDPRKIKLELKNPANLQWINPDTGKKVSKKRLPAGVHEIMVPGKQDMILLVRW